MIPSVTLPTPEALPAPWWLFEVLTPVLFGLHILLVNIVLGGALILLVTRLMGAGHELNRTLSGSAANKLPTSLALAITIGIAPLLFIQVSYGHLFYSSSVLMGRWWILVIPILILGYYGLYVHNRKGSSRQTLGTIAMAVSALALLYVSFIFSNNISLMERPDTWGAYFASRTGTLMNAGDVAQIPRWLHFVTASVAVAGLFMAFVWHLRGDKGDKRSSNQVAKGLRVFAFATIAQILIGFWWLIALPREIMMQFMGGSIVMTILLLLGLVLAIGALVVALLGKLMPTVFHLLGLIVVMVTMRNMLRFSYLDGIFHPKNLELNPQYGVLVLFLIVLALGLWAVWWMVKQVRMVDSGRSGQ